VAAAPGPPTGATTLTGWLQPSEGARVDDSDRTDDVLPQLRVADAIQHVDVDLFGAYVVLDPARASGNAGDAGLDRARLVELPDAGRFTAVRNLFYALEWWVFAGFALFVWWRWARDEVTAADGSAAPDPADEEVAAGS
jgi:cytochrome oxidase assembly protein ShyY1